MLAATQPGRLAALVTTGAWPPRDPTASRAMLPEFARSFRAQGVRAALAEACEQEGIEPPEWMIDLDPNGEAVARLIEGMGAFAWEEHGMPAQIGVPTLEHSLELDRSSSGM